MGLGPAAEYLAQFNGHVLPGYVQDETFDSILNVESHYGAYVDGSNSEDTGLSNKSVSIRMKVWEQDYLTCKEQVQLAATMLRSVRGGFAPLYVGYTDKYYTAMTKSIKMDKSVGASVRTAEYDVDFECLPWLTNDTPHVLTGTGTVSTSQVSRTIADGSQTPTVVTVTGTDVTISGYTTTGDYTGFISISGAVTDLIIDTENFSATTISGVNMNEYILNVDFQLNVGVGETSFDITGATDCSIEYYDRWHL